MASHLTGGKTLARNTFWSLGSNIASILIALVTVPILLRYLGADRFGIISLVWVVEGQFSIFDLGLSQALTKTVASMLGTGKDEEIPPVFWASVVFMACMGVLAAIFLRLLSHWLAYSVLKVPTGIQPETEAAFHLVAWSLPVVISSAALRGYLSAHQRFDLLSTTRVPISLFSYLAPLAVLPFVRSMTPYVLVLVLSRVLAWIVHMYLCLRITPALRQNLTFAGAPLSQMIRFGSWMTVTNIISPIMVNFDRLFIGALISSSAVAYYVTAYEAAAKAWILPSAITGVIFPAISAALPVDRQRVVQLYENSTRYIFISVFPLVLGGICIGRPVLTLWLGSAVAEHSLPVFRFILVGVLANSLAQVPFWYLQAASRPDLPAKVHILEVPLYLGVLNVCIHYMGVSGAGLAWMLRMIVDTVIMFVLSNRLLPEVRIFARRLVYYFLVTLPLIVAGACIRNNVIASLYFAIALATYVLVVWYTMLNSTEREAVLARYRSLFVSASQYPTLLP